jgi:hypothetical protein
MGERLEGAARRAGIDAAGSALILAAYRAAMAHRAPRLADEHHIDYLHPGRTALILIDDLGITDAEVVAAGVLTETLVPELEARAPSEIPPAVLALRDQVPTPPRSGERLLEDLLVADEAIRLIALAERLDHDRHLHLRDQGEWSARHHESCTVYRALAPLTHPTLERRYRWWCDTFERRFLGRG